MKFEMIKDLDKKDKLRFAIGLIVLLISAFILIAIDTNGEVADKMNNCMQTYSYDYCSATVR